MRVVTGLELRRGRRGRILSEGEPLNAVAIEAVQDVHCPKACLGRTQGWAESPREVCTGLVP